MKIDYSKTLLKLRARMNLSQEASAEMLNVSFAVINRWENEQYESTKSTYSGFWICVKK